MRNENKLDEIGKKYDRVSEVRSDAGKHWSSPSIQWKHP